MGDNGISIRSMCLSGHRKDPLGSHDSNICKRSLEIRRKVVGLAAELAIAVVQLEDMLSPMSLEVPIVVAG